MRQARLWICTWRSGDGEKRCEAHYSAPLVLWIWKLIIKFNSWLTRKSKCFNIWCQMLLQGEKKNKRERDTELKLWAISPNISHCSSEYLINLDNNILIYFFFKENILWRGSLSKTKLSIFSERGERIWNLESDLGLWAAWFRSWKSWHGVQKWLLTTQFLGISPKELLAQS